MQEISFIHSDPTGVWVQPASYQTGTETRFPEVAKRGVKLKV
jgi:hypothetical protein